MSHQIIEYIGKNKLVHSNPNPVDFYDRMKTPRAGDVIDFGEDYKNNPWPYNTNRYGRIEGHNFWCEKEDDYHVCTGGASCYWWWNEDEKRSGVSISGGPFTVINIKNLQVAHTTMPVRFWNWGNNSPGGGMGVDYMVDRPVFKWVATPERE